MASRDLLRSENATDRIPGILGVRSKRTKASLAVSTVDGGDGTTRPSQAKKSVRFAKTYELENVLSPPAQIVSLLAQCERSRRNVKGGSASPHARLASVRWVSAHSAVALASSSPEHVAEHAR